ARELLGLPPDRRRWRRLDHLIAGGRVKLRQLLADCLGQNSPLPISLTLAGGDTLSCEGWRYVPPHSNEPLVILRQQDRPALVAQFALLAESLDSLNREIRARRAAEARLHAAMNEALEANAAKDRMLAQVSHDLRTPLNAIIGMSEVMERGMFGILNDHYQGYAVDIRRSGHTLLEIVEKLLNVAAGTSASQRVRDALTDLSDCIESCESVIRPLADNKGLRLMLPHQLRLPQLKSDGGLIKQMLLNLLGNAVKYTPAGGEVKLETETPKDGSLVLRVRDTGPGIPASRLSRLFTPFNATGDPYVRSSDSFGLGLYLTKQSADAIGAELTIHSRVGVGTVAELHFPRDCLNAR
ncbi:MAG TPA: HAMP domain-containing sensor histidine kinase, partial [Alphaproteobacteria bacterium]|nr:HAMP domain-containing sensor histidine kinase [Alphaproteobacteria bacterium]